MERGKNMNKIISALLVVVMIGAVVWSFAFGVPITESFRLKESK